MSFNKLFGVDSLDEYQGKIGTIISYSHGFSVVCRSDDKCVVKFQTRTYYPIKAIIKAIELSHEVEWYAVEENYIYISKFHWDNHVREDVLLLDEEYSDWSMKNIDYDDAVFEENEADCGVWYYLRYNKHGWREWKSDDNFSRYESVANEVKYPFSNNVYYF